MIGRVTRLPEPCLVVVVGPAGCGKSTSAARWFRPEQVISSDRLRAMVGTGERDQRAGTAAFEVLDLIIDHRLRRRLTTIVDSTALEAVRRKVYVDAARRRGVAVVAAVFDLPEREVRRRNRQRADGVPAAVITAQLRSFAAARAAIESEGFDAVVPVGDDGVVLVPPQFVAAPHAAKRQQEDPMPLTFGLQLPRFTWPGGAAELGQRLADVAAAAEQAGFDSIWVMDHYVQIPQVGREWEEMLEAYTTLGYLAGLTRTGAPRRAVHRHHLSQRRRPRKDRRHARRAVRRTGDGRARHRLVRARARASTAGSSRRAGTATRCSRTRFSCCRCCGARARRGSRGGRSRCPRRSATRCPLQEQVPILVGGSGERRTLRLVARYADACNLFGDAATVRDKVEVLHRHCADVDRDPSEVTVTNLT